MSIFYFWICESHAYGLRWMHSLHQAPIDSILEKTILSAILRYCIHMHPNEPFIYNNHKLKASKSATLSEEHFDNQKLITTTHHHFQHSAHHSPTPSASFFNANWRLHLRLNAEKQTGNQSNIDSEDVLRCWTMFSALIVGLLNLYKLLQSKWNNHENMMATPGWSELPTIGLREWNNDGSWTHFGVSHVVQVCRRKTCEAVSTLKTMGCAIPSVQT